MSLCCVVWRLVSYTSPLSLSLLVLHRTMEAYRSTDSAAALLSKTRLADSSSAYYVNFFHFTLTQFPTLSVVLPDARVPVPVKDRFFSERKYGLSDRFIIQRNARAVTVVANRPVRVYTEATGCLHSVHIRTEKQELPTVFFLLPLYEPPELPITVATTRIFLPVRGNHKEGVRRAFFRARLAVQISDVPNRIADCIEQRGAAADTVVLKAEGLHPLDIFTVVQYLRLVAE